MIHILSLALAIVPAPHTQAVQRTELSIEFDNPSPSPREILDRIQLPSNKSFPGPKPESEGIPAISATIRTETGEWRSVEPKLRNGKETNYEFPLGTIVRWTLSCRTENPNPNPNYWSALAFHETLPAFGGHDKAHKLPPPNLQTPSGDDLPNPVETRTQAPNSDFSYDFHGPRSRTDIPIATRIAQRAVFSGLCRGTLTATVDFKLSGLIQMPAGGRSKGYSLVSNDDFHSREHFVTPKFGTTLKAIGMDWKRACPNSRTLLYNDMSLPWGGLFDLKGQWEKPHAGHANGTDADVSKRWVRKGNRGKLLDVMCTHANVFSEGDEPKEAPHYHLISKSSQEEVDAKYIPCCPGNLRSGYRQACIDLGSGHSEELPEASDCTVPALAR